MNHDIKIGQPALIQVTRPSNSYYVACIESTDHKGIKLMHAGIAKVGGIDLRKAPSPVLVDWADVVLVIQEADR